jgi:hypothetical protein
MMAGAETKITSTLSEVNQSAKVSVGNTVKNVLNDGKNSVTVDGAGVRTRYDLAGKTHGDVPTPHKQSYIYNTNPATGAGKYARASKEATSMSWSDMFKASIGAAKK